MRGLFSTPFSPVFPRVIHTLHRLIHRRGVGSLFVGAMKIARNVAVFGRYDEWYAPLPAPSLRELSSECETEGVYFDERKRLKVSEPI